ncbi:MAG: hypothetical protein HYX79_02010 [Chloroflexi bacterium]|nr:hypothetical protein [Chloroflexota bacterium]
MKPSKSSTLLLAGGVPIILFGSLGMAHSQQVTEQTTLVKQLSSAGQRLAKFQIKELSAKKEELEKLISQAVTQTESARLAISQTIDSIDASTNLLWIARESGVEITELSSSEPGKTNLEGIPFSALTLTAKAEGEIPRLISFIEQVNGEFTTGTIESFQVSIPDKPDIKPSVSIRLILYTYKGASNVK